MKYAKLILSGLMAVALMGLLPGCSTEIAVDSGGAGTVSAQEGVTVVMTLNIPGAATTRALTSAQEDAVNNVDILVFDKNLKLVDWQYGQLTNNSGEVAFSAILQSSRDNNDKFRIMALANVRAVTYALFNGADLGGHKDESYGDVCAALKASVPAYSGLLSKGIPMWGEIENAILINSTNYSYSMDLLRSLARIDIGTNANPAYDTATGQITGWAALTNFSVEGVYAYNTGTAYALAPDRANYSFSSKKVSAATFPASYTKNSTPQEYSDNAISGTVTRTGTTGISITGNIYTGEDDVVMAGTYGDNNHLNRMALVVAGYYSEDPENPNTTTCSYYRLDFVESTDDPTLMNLLRNHDYQVVIKAVKGPGSPTKEEAFKKYNTEIVASVLTWIPANQGATVVDGQNFLSVSDHDLELGKWANADTRITIETNMSDWKATILNPADTWIQLYNASTGVAADPLTGVSGGELRFSVGEIPTGVTDRTAQIRITAGTMTLDVMVKQTDRDQEFMLRLSHSELNFIGRKWDAATQTWKDPDPQDLKIAYGPTLHNYRMSLTAYLGGGVSGITLPIPAESNLAEMVIQPDAIDPLSAEVAADPFYVRSSRLAFTVRNVDQSETIVKSVAITQTFYSLLLTETFDYYMQGQAYTLRVRANSPWRATYSGDESIFSIHSNTSGTGDTSAAGETLNFTIAGNATPDKVAYITFSSPTNLFPPQTIKISAQDDLPNCYIVAPGGSVTIPVRKAYRVWELDRDLGVDLTSLPGTRTVELLWQDTWSSSTGGIINTVGSLTGNEENAAFTVSTSSIAGQGNAVVAFKIDGKIYWSWHIWVTSYDPETTFKTYSTFTLMDRNLGATSGEPPSIGSDISSVGLYYQGSRKDPWIGSLSFTNATAKPQYDISGGIVSLDTSTPSPVGVNLNDVINNPLTYYLGTYGNTSWYGAFETMRTDFWITNDRKGDFDPCPKGWTVPNKALYLNSGTPVNANTGFTFAGSYFPRAGCRIPVYTMSGLATYGYFWATDGNNHFPLYYISASVGIVQTTTSARSAYAASIRCVKE